MRSRELAPGLSAASGLPRGGETFWEEGAVTGVDPDTYLYIVRSDDGAQHYGIRRIAHSPGSYDLLAVGTRVVIAHGPPTGPYIVGVIAHPPTDDGVILPEYVDERRAVTPGDRIMQSPAGNMVAALNTGVTVLRSNAYAYITADKDGHVVQSSLTHENRTLFGNVRTWDNASGETGFTLRAGSSVPDHTSELLHESATFRVDAGASANMLSVRVTETDGTTKSEYFMGSDGTLRVISDAGRFTDIKSDDTRLVAGDDIVQVERTSTEVVKELKSVTYGDYVAMCRGAYAQDVMGVMSRAILGADNLVVQGSKMQRVSGSFMQEVGGAYQHVLTALPLPIPQDMLWWNKSGNMNFILNNMPPTGQSFNVYADTVNLGASMAGTVQLANGLYQLLATPIAPDSAVLFERLNAWFNMLCEWLDTHQHNTSVGPTTPASVLLGGLSLQATTKMGLTFAAAKSQRVKIGG